MALPDEGATRAPTVDDWGRDPQVRMMRRIFARIEVLQKQLLETIGISPFDQRLGRWRKAALHLFEEEWMERSGRGTPLSEKDVANTYTDCLINVLRKDGVTLSDEALQGTRS